MLIEVAGVDGAGKTTVIDAVRRHLQQTTTARAYERAVRSESRNLLERLALTAGDPRLFPGRDQEIAVLLDAVRQGQGELLGYRGSRVSHVFVTGYRCSLLARLRAAGLAADDGLLAILGELPAPDVAVLLDAPADVALARIRARAKGDQILRADDPRAAVTVRAAALRWSAERFPHVRLDACRPVADLSGAVIALLAPGTGAGDNPAIDPGAAGRARIR